MQDLAREARPSTSMACNIFVSQLPLSIQPSLREWLDVREEVGTKEARELIVKVKTALVEKNIPLDYGYREYRKDRGPSTGGSAQSTRDTRNERYHRMRVNARQYTLRLAVGLEARHVVRVMGRADRDLLKDVPVANREDVVLSAGQTSISCPNVRSGTAQSAEKKDTKPGIAPTQKAIGVCFKQCPGKRE